jgi:outer membrane protein
VNAKPRPEPAAARWRWACARAVFALALCALAGLPVSAQQAAATRVGYVDMKRLIDSSPQVRAARARLQREFDAASALLRTDEARLQALEARLTEAIRTEDDEAERSLRREVEPLKRSVERTRERLRAELETRSEQEIDRAWPLINDSIAEYARAQGFDLVISSGALYVSGRIDITDRVLEVLEREVAEGEQP